MSKASLTVLAVCGSGVVSSSMIAQKIEEVVSSMGVRVNVIGLLPTSVQSYVERGGIDFVVSTSPIPGDISVPVIKGVALLTGFGEDECIEEIKSVAQKIISEKNS